MTTVATSRRERPVSPSPSEDAATAAAAALVTTRSGRQVKRRNFDIASRPQRLKRRACPPSPKAREYDEEEEKEEARPGDLIATARLASSLVAALETMRKLVPTAAAPAPTVAATAATALPAQHSACNGQASAADSRAAVGWLVVVPLTTLAGYIDSVHEAQTALDAATKHTLLLHARMDALAKERDSLAKLLTARTPSRSSTAGPLTERRSYLANDATVATI